MVLISPAIAAGHEGEGHLASEVEVRRQETVLGCSRRVIATTEVGATEAVMHSREVAVLGRN